MVVASVRLTTRRAMLSYSDPCAGGIRRIARGKGFAYESAAGRRITDAKTLERINGLVLPPAWRDVCISTKANGHLQAVGIDARGRKQYRYHDRWTEHRNRTKFEGLPEFARALPKIRRAVRRHMKLPGMPREKVLACIVHLLDAAHVRIGNDEYAKTNKSYGLTTLKNTHVKVAGGDVRFRFRAKSGKDCDITLHDKRTARIVRACQDLPGQELFAYVDEGGKVRDVTSSDVNDYLGEIAGLHVTAKDFRTWAGTVTAAETFLTFAAACDDDGMSAAALKKCEVAAVQAASVALNNTVATCRKFYVHPGLAELHAKGSLLKAIEHAKGTPASGGERELSATERAVLGLLGGGTKRAAKKPRAAA